MTVLLAADDIQKGQFVSVYSHTTQANQSYIHQPDCPASLPTTPTLPAGLPLRVLEHSLPFVACTVVQPGGIEDGPVILDLREVNLCRLTENFIKAIITFKPHDSADKDEPDEDTVTS